MLFGDGGRWPARVVCGVRAVDVFAAGCSRPVRGGPRGALELPAATATLLSAPTGAMRKALTSPDQNDARRQYQEGSTLPAWRSGRLTAAGAGAPISIDATGLVGGRFGSKNAERKAMYLEQMKREEKWSTGRRCTIAPPPGKPPAPGLARGGSSWDLLRGANVGRPTPGLAQEADLKVSLQAAYAANLAALSD